VASKALKLTVHIEGLRETLAKLRDLPDEASDRLRDQATELAEDLAAAAADAARADRSPQSRLLAPTVKARRDRVPVVVAGGAKRVGSRRAPAYTVLFGSEFGSNRYGQFRKRHQGTRGSWFFPTVEARQSEIDAAWNKAADEIIAEFTAGGDG
jgi:hypothetical protein